MYFVIDYATVTAEGVSQPLLLYVGETIKSNQRWKGEHDCKRYLLNYRQSHYDNGLKSELGIAFWPEAPADRKARQQIESALISRWRSPFNKENWQFWNTPFVDGKQSAQG
ncbi:MAG: GIY-YIG nuclease family protein, partial [Cyanobacteria bacterium J06588_5]